jgi:hypothetical protein
MSTNTSTTTSTCGPVSEMPGIDSLPIPQNINVVSTPGNDTAYPPMASCCAPNRVQIVDGCYLWCEIPKSYFNGTDNDGAGSAFSTCLRLRRGDDDAVRITGYQFSAAAARPGVGSAKQIGVWVLALSGLIYVL